MAHPFALLGALLEYPRPQDDRLPQCRAALADLCPEAASHLEGFADRLTALSLSEREETYTATFDLNPVSSLEVGWHLFGENYTRGELLVLFRQKMRAAGLSESVELPDHLTQVLPLLAQLPASEAAELASRYVAPAVERMLAGLEGKNSPYEGLLRAVHAAVAALAAHHAGAAETVPPARALALPLIDHPSYEAGHD